MEIASVKIKTLTLLDVLQKESDEDHPLPARRICELMEERGISCERKSLYRDIELLVQHGVDIVKTRLPVAGFFLAHRSFEVAEVRLLLDAAISAPFITQKKTAELTQKLLGLLSDHQAKTLMAQGQGEPRVKFSNEEIYYNIDAVNTAISRGVKLSFHYHHRVATPEGGVGFDEGREFTVSPYALIWDRDKYYVVGNYEKYSDLSNYRLDRMKQATVLDLPSRPFAQVCEYRDCFDAADYARKALHMYNGKQQFIQLKCDNSMRETVAERFGDALKLIETGEDSFSARVCVYVSDGLIEWLLQYGSRIEVLSPVKLRSSMREKVRDLARTYGMSEI